MLVGSNAAATDRRDQKCSVYKRHCRLNILHDINEIAEQHDTSGPPLNSALPRSVNQHATKSQAAVGRQGYRKHCVRPKTRDEQPAGHCLPCYCRRASPSFGKHPTMNLRKRSIRCQHCGSMSCARHHRCIQTAHPCRTDNRPTCNGSNRGRVRQSEPFGPSVTWVSLLEIRTEYRRRRSRPSVPTATAARRQAPGGEARIPGVERQRAADVRHRHRLRCGRRASASHRR